MLIASSLALAATLAQAPPPIAPVPMAPIPQSAAPPPPPQPRRAGTPPRRISGAITEHDYPAEALRTEAQGTTVVRLVISRDGSVVGCKVTSSSGHGVLDVATCDLMQERFRFAPARDRKGHPRVDTVSGRLTWRIEPRPPEMAPFPTPR